LAPLSRSETAGPSFLADIEARDQWAKFSEWLEDHQDPRWVFRGEPKCATRLRPSIGRHQPWEENREFQVYNLFYRRSRLFGQDNGSLSFVERLALAQHHGLPTRLLDWSTNPLAAVFFAIQPEAGRGNAVVHAIDAPEVGFFTVEEVQSPELIRDLGETKFLEIAALLPRIAAQRGMFSLHHRPDTNWKPPGGRRKEGQFSILGSSKPYFLERLHQLGLDASTVMTDLDGLCDSLRWWYRSGLKTPSTIGRRLRYVTGFGSKA
jgi:hypothetical protein